MSTVMLDCISDRFTHALSLMIPIAIQLTAAMCIVTSQCATALLLHNYMYDCCKEVWYKALTLTSDCLVKYMHKWSEIFPDALCHNACTPSTGCH